MLFLTSSAEMERLTIFVTIFCVLFVYSEASCWSERTGNGYYCTLGNMILTKGRTYYSETAPNCFKCTCSDDAYQLNCCGVGNTINRIPDNCQIKQVGCNQVAVSKADPSKPCKGPVGGVV
uniref:Beta-microseminoprotein n=3 Tax=Magallana gigas TaxID=29159 RepID=A0A8W8HSL4_MAGGI|nr:prostate-associated microseminoprotein-like [Crassostrea gigas]